MKPTRIVPVALLVVASGFALQSASAQQQGVKRTELQRHDLSVPGREVIQVRVDLDPGMTFPCTRIPVKRSSTCWKACGSIRSRARAR